MIYEVRNQYDNVPYVNGLKEMIVDAYQKDKTSLTFGYTEIDIEKGLVSNDKTVIQVHIHNI